MTGMANQRPRRFLYALGVGVALLFLAWIWNQGSQTDPRPGRGQAGSLPTSDSAPILTEARDSTNADGAWKGNEHSPDSVGSDLVNRPEREGPLENRWGTAKQLEDLERRGYKDWNRLIPQSEQVGVLRNPVPYLYADNEYDREAAIQLVCGALRMGSDSELWAEVLKANERIPSKERGLFMYAVVGTGLPESRAFMLMEMRHTDAIRRAAAFTGANAILGWPENSPRVPIDDWLVNYLQQTKSAQSPNEVMLALVEALEPLAGEAVRDELPAVRELAAMLKLACERCRKEIETGGRARSQTYPDALGAEQEGAPK